MCIWSPEQKHMCTSPFDISIYTQAQLKLWILFVKTIFDMHEMHYSKLSNKVFERQTLTLLIRLLQIILFYHSFWQKFSTTQLKFRKNKFRFCNQDIFGKIIDHFWHCLFWQFSFEFRRGRFSQCLELMENFLFQNGPKYWKTITYSEF